MKIVHLIWGFLPGGIETMLIDIVNEQVKLVDVAIVVINNLVDQHMVKSLDDRAKIFFCGRKQGSLNPLPILKMNYYLYEVKPDVIHFHGKRLRVYTLHNSKKAVTAD